MKIESEKGVSEKFKDAQLTQWLWKTDAMKRMAIAIVELALKMDEFAADDIPKEMDHGGPGIAGSICAKLANNGIITRCGVIQGDTFYPKIRASRNSKSNASPIGVWKLMDFRKAEAFLRCRHVVRSPHQAELTLA